jgi:thiol-disulfide isomerase/thioredoxin
MNPICTTRRSTVWVLLTACVTVAHVSLAAAEETALDRSNSSHPLPRYQLKVGQDVVYKLTRQQEYTDGKPETPGDMPRDDSEWRVFVAGENPDGSWRLLIRMNRILKHRDGSIRVQMRSLSALDLMPNGSYTVDERTAIVQRLVPQELFCRLPDTEAELNAGWKFKMPLLGYVCRLCAEKLAQDRLRIMGVEESIYAEMHHWEQTRDYTFDTARGLMTSIASDFKDTAANQLKSRRVIELVSVNSHSPEWMSAFRAEADRYLDDFRKWLGLVYDGTRARTVADCTVARAKARQVLEAGRSRANFQVVWDSYDTELQQHSEDDKYEAEAAAKRNQFFSMAANFANDWQAKDFDGNVFRLAEHRGKPVVLFFWGTNCEYCVLMGPQLKQLASEFDGKGALVLGMFCRRENYPRDKEDVDAKFLIDRAYQGFPHIDATEIEKQYRLPELNLGHPSIIVLDSMGKPHAIQLGYSADLLPRLRATIHDLQHN